MREEKTLSELQDLFREVFGEKGLVISRTTTARDIRPWDSLNHMHLIAEVEKKFMVEFTFDEVLALRNVGDLHDLILKKAKV
jgi:acyl carrier protein